MAVVARFLVDTSAAARLSHHQVAERVTPLISAGVVGTCAALDYEALYSARTPAEHERLRVDRRAAYEYLPTNDEHWSRALDVQRALARRSRHRDVGLPDLLIAAVAEQHHVALLHYDRDFETLGSFMGLESAWVAAPGSLP